MNYEKLIDAMLDRGIDEERAIELADWWCYAPKGTPYPDLSKVVICNSAKWEEGKHPRAKDGKFTSGGKGYSADPEWRRRGKQSMGEVSTPKLQRLRKKMQDQRDEEYVMSIARLGYSPEQREKVERTKDRRKRQEAELVRQEKHRQRLERERQLDRGVGELERELDDLENHIDYLEEGYADRSGGSTRTFDFPSPEAKAEYEDLIRQRDELETRIREMKSPRRKRAAPSSRTAQGKNDAEQLLFEREQAEHFAQVYSASNPKKAEAYRRMMNDIDEELDRLGVE